jgi:hypothetical protein
MGEEVAEEEMEEAVAEWPEEVEKKKKIDTPDYYISDFLFCSFFL